MGQKESRRVCQRSAPEPHLACHHGPHVGQELGLAVSHNRHHGQLQGKTRGSAQGTARSTGTGSPAEPGRSPIPGRSPVSRAHSTRPREEQPCRGRAHLAVLILPLQAAGQRGEDEAMTGVGAAARRGLLRAAQPLPCDTGAQGLPGHPAPGTALAPSRPSAGHPRGEPPRTASSRPPLLGHRVPFPGSGSPSPGSPGPHSPGTQ